MRLIWAHLTVTEPLFDSAILVPGVIAGEGLLGWSGGVLEDIVLAVQDGLGLDRLLVRVGVLGLLSAELLLVFDVLVGVVDINMSGRQSLNLNRVKTS